MKQEKEKCCGNCCWFYAEDTYGCGACPFQFGEVVQCDRPCKCEKEFVSKEEIKRHRFTMLQYLRAVNYYNSGDLKAWSDVIYSSEELDAAIEFANKYIKIFSKL